MSLFSKQIDMTHGSIVDKLILFAIPLGLMSFLEQLFNASDFAVLGQFVGKDAVAAVGNNFILTSLIVYIFIGIALGANVVIAQCIGGRKFDAASRASHTSLILAVCLGIGLMVMGEFFSSYLLDWLSVPSEVKPMAKTYLQIYLLSLPAFSLYNFLAAIFRSLGNTKTPLVGLLIATAVNLLCNYLFVHLFSDGVAGVATATVLAMYVAASYLFFHLFRLDDVVRFHRKALHVDWILLRRILGVGVPTAIQGMVFCLSNILIQEAINNLGPEAMAASTISLAIEMFIYCVLSSFTQAGTTFISQNYGAKNLHRCFSVTKWCFILDFIATSSVCFLAMIGAEYIISIFTGDPLVMDLTITRMWYVVVFEVVQLGIEMVNAIMRGYGVSFLPAILTLVGICGVRVLWLITAFAWAPSFERLMLVYPISWAVGDILLVGLYIYFTKHMMKYLRVNFVLHH